MSRTFLIADTHFGHKNILKLANRSFLDIDSMDTTIIKNWNKKVKKGDKIFILGDVSFYDLEGTKEIISNLNGHKVLVKGNHDKRKNDFWIETGFQEVSKYPIVLTLERIILSHAPIELPLDDFFNIHGHVHNNIGNYEDKYPDKYKCVSVERINYSPILLRDIILEQKNKVKK